MCINKFVWNRIAYQNRKCKNTNYIYCVNNQGMCVEIVDGYLFDKVYRITVHCTCTMYIVNDNDKSAWTNKIPSYFIWTLYCTTHQQIHTDFIDIEFRQKKFKVLQNVFQENILKNSFLIIYFYITKYKYINSYSYT